MSLLRGVLLSPIRRLLLLAVAAAGPACSHYQLGTGVMPAFATLHVAPVANPAGIPQAEPLVGTQLRGTLIRDGRVQLLDDAQSSDAVLEVSLVGYTREAATARPDDTGLGRIFNLTLSATVSLRDRRTGELLLSNRRVDVSRDAFVDGGLQQSEYQALPLLAESLSRRITDMVLDVW